MNYLETIREGTYETNSSSMHALVINNSPARYKGEMHIEAKFMDFSCRQLELHTDPNEKFSYLYMVLCNLISFPVSKNYENNNKDKSYTDEEISLIKDRFSLLKDLFNAVNKDLNEHNDKMSLDFDDLDININKEYGRAYLTSKSEEYWSMGCYGNEMIEAYYEMKRAANDINDFLDGKIDIAKVIDNCYVRWYFEAMFDFAFDKNSIFIQHTDEYEEKDYKKHLKTIKEYVNRCDGDVTVIWPIGG